MDYDVTLAARVSGGALSLTQKVVVPVTARPVSKRISDYGAHNQRSHGDGSGELASAMALEEQIRIAESRVLRSVGAAEAARREYVTNARTTIRKFRRRRRARRGAGA